MNDHFELAEVPPRRRLGIGTWLLAGILLVLALLLSQQDAGAEQAAVPIVGQHNAIAQPPLRGLGSAIRMPQLATVATTPILGAANAIQQPQLAVATSPILDSSNAIQQPQLVVATSPILGSSNAIQQPSLAFAGLGSQLQAVRLPILGSGNAIVAPRLGSSLGMTTTPTLVDLPTTGAGSASDSLIPNPLVVLLAGLAIAAFSLACWLQRQLVPRQPASRHLVSRQEQPARHGNPSRRPRLRLNQVQPVQPLHRSGGVPIT